jgi:predicted DNA-binding ribbon-helix-helix protein
MARTSYKSRRLNLGDKVTAISLEPQWWAMLEDVCTRQNRSMRWVLLQIEKNRGDVGRPTAIQSYITRYYMNLVQSYENDATGLNLSRDVRPQIHLRSIDGVSRVGFAEYG